MSIISSTSNKDLIIHEEPYRHQLEWNFCTFGLITIDGIDLFDVQLITIYYRESTKAVPMDIFIAGHRNVCIATDTKPVILCKF